jgi:hypothetical protein
MSQLGFKDVILTGSRSLPIFPDQRTFLVSVGMSQRCHEETLALQQTALSLDHLVGASQ